MENCKLNQKLGHKIQETGKLLFDNELKTGQLKYEL